MPLASFGRADSIRSDRRTPYDSMLHHILTLAESRALGLLQGSVRNRKGLLPVMNLGFTENFGEHLCR